MNIRLIIAGAVSGLVSAILVDVHAWSKSDPALAFDWGLAVKRWVGGAVSGALAGLGLKGLE
jgi:hypothetical protein